MAPALCPPHSLLPTWYLYGAAAKNWRSGTKFTAHRGRLFLPCCHVATSMLGMTSAAPCSNPTQPGPGHFQGWGSCSGQPVPVPQHPQREGILLCIRECFREQSPAALGPVALPELVHNTNHLLGLTVLSPRVFMSSLQQASGSYSF